MLFCYKVHVVYVCFFYVRLSVCFCPSQGCHNPLIYFFVRLCFWVSMSLCFSVIFVSVCVCPSICCLCPCFCPSVCFCVCLWVERCMPKIVCVCGGGETGSGTQEPVSYSHSTLSLSSSLAIALYLSLSLSVSPLLCSLLSAIKTL